MAEAQVAAGEILPDVRLTPWARIKAILGGSAGNLVEWYDWFAYASFSLYFAKVFFPAGDQTTQLLNAAGVFAAGFLMRPIGSWLFGRIADKSGRRISMMVAVIMMCGGSLLVAVLPAMSDCVASTAYCPSRRSAAGLTDQAPSTASALRGVPTRGSSAVPPLWIATVTPGRSPSAVPAVPEKIGLAFFVSVPVAGLAMVTDGTLVSIWNVVVRLEPVRPNVSVCVARAL